MDNKVFSEIFARAREQHPLVHHITNYVTVNDCANITLCAGGAPVMADAREEAGEMAGFAGALVLNIGTLNPGIIESMILAGNVANERRIPVILDPVGAGATRLRTESTRRLLEELKIAIIKGNAGEIGVLAGADAKVRGVDSAGITGDPVTITRTFARETGITVVMSGATDIISDGKRILLVENGHPRMGAISGTGCMVTSVTGVCAAVEKDRVMAAATALAAFGMAGEQAAAASKGPGSFKPALFDAMAALAPEALLAGARVRSA
ncbi:hydroxyethylthiazole kinase [Methanoregula sp.]|uniref:hydroxyethylthiazole kinase n=1 Tax=Methanoregula sp. TaxID=2052170 RepID=UPI002BB8F905|nr:hydroxyethylthiazole kinase [Methanoregula sp.]HVP97063.1 hydroxyethylthiazole kinase [Methanoregula sp.]